MSGPVLVLCVGIGARANEARYGGRLGRRIPPWRIWTTDRSEMQWFSAATVPRPDLCSGVDEFGRHLWAIRGSGKVQSCIARVDVVADLYKEVRAGARSLTGCSILERRGRQRWALAHHSGESYSIVVDDCVYQPS